MKDPKIALKRLIKELKNISGRHTELVSVYVPSGYDLDAIKTQVFQEKGTAVNIKSKATRKNVISALDKILQEFKLFKKTPPNGLAIFSGNISKKDGEQDLKIWIIEPPEPLNIKMYRCDQTFLLSPLIEMVENNKIYGLIVVDNKNVTMGYLRGKSIIVLKEDDSIVPGKIRAGGQSSARFARVRENLAKDWYKSIAQNSEKFFGKNEVIGIIIGGPGPTKETFMGYLSTKLKEKVIGIKDIGYTGEYGLRELVNKSLDTLKENAIAEEKNVLFEFFLRISKGKKVAYGKKEVENALDIGAVEKMLIKEDGDESLEKKAEDLSIDVIYISSETSEGEQFNKMGGYGALLRFEIS